MVVHVVDLRLPCEDTDNLALMAHNISSSFYYLVLSDSLAS